MSAMELAAHAYGTVNAGTLTASKEVFCVLARSAEGVYTVTMASGTGISVKALKATVAFNGGSAVFFTVEWTSDLVYTVRFFNAASAAKDPAALWVTLERMTQVNV